MPKKPYYLNKTFPQRCEWISNWSAVWWNYWCTAKQDIYDIQTWDFVISPAPERLLNAKVMWILMKCYAKLKNCKHAKRISWQNWNKCPSMQRVWKETDHAGTLSHILSSAWPYFVFAQVSAVARIQFPMATLEPRRWTAVKGFR